MAKFLLDLGIEISCNRDIAIVILLIFPAFGPSSGIMTKKALDTSTQVFKLLKKQGMKVYKECITTNNNENLRDEFFGTPIIKQLWQKLAPEMKM